MTQGAGFAGTIGSSRPDWVMTGMPAPDDRGVWLLASKELSYAELAAQVDRGPDWWDGGPAAVPGPVIAQRITLTVGMRTFLLIEAPDYPAAFKALFDQWTPGPADRPRLGPPPRALPP